MIIHTCSSHTILYFFQCVRNIYIYFTLNIFLFSDIISNTTNPIKRSTKYMYTTFSNITKPAAFLTEHTYGFRMILRINSDYISNQLSSLY
jgi:hypothetical protein